ncbi:DNA alkylation repair protein [Halobacillus massiliensis]|uniref:DNA alkylation repair protein n=1 Tax=Halobacillus massiliensis TaxID=1926286 RepID=UPI0009E381BC|nr:DNA alkylation repair protein [Halobacillus massiliensis]
MKPYLCPNCKTNRSRFNRIKQVSTSIQLDPRSGEVISECSNGQLASYHMDYQGPEYKVQCGACGLIEDERTFLSFAEHNPLT